MTTISIFLAILMSAYILRRVYARYCLTNLDVAVTVSAATATEGDTLTLTEVLSNSKWLPLPWVSVKFRAGRELFFAYGTSLSDANYRNDLFHILMHQKITRRQQFTANKRGYYTIDGLELTAWDILMERKYIRRFPCDVRLTVYPRGIEMAEIDALCTRVYGQLRTRHPINPDPFSFRGIREYSPSDPMKIVNFKASARGMGLMVNMWEFSNARQVKVLLDVSRYSVMYNEYLDERAIKIAASIVEKMTQIGAPVSFITNGRSITSGHAANIPEGLGIQHTHTILETLALVDTQQQDIEPFVNYLNEIALDGHHGPEYWIITPYFSKEVEDAYTQLAKTGARTVWIMPAPQPSDVVYNDDIIFV